ncbi:MAG: hypothetical protein HUJ29_05200 [Gammaproteobacteria bacterium]|nr:hypothetical protein [Gammaproteobacteria bacterium]
MKKLLVMGLLVSGLAFAHAAQARSVIVGTDLVAMADNQPNLFYQSRAFSNSAYRLSGVSAAGGLSAGLAFRFYIERYADSPYIQAEIQFGNTTETGAKVGIDLPVGNIIFDPYISTFSSTTFGLNLGLRL